MANAFARLAGLLQIEHAIVLAPMAGGVSTPELVAAVSEAGGLGSIGAAYLTPAQIAEQCAAVRRLTKKPFAVNLFAGGRDARSATDQVPPRLQRWYADLGLPPPEPPKPQPDPFEAQLAAVIEAAPAVFSFTFGLPSAAQMLRLKARNLRVIGTATTVREAVILERAGVDAIAAQGSEAGAHRGTFDAAFHDSLIGTIALVPMIVDAVKVPVLASGGIMDGRGIAAARCLGASGVQMGTAFLTCKESGAPPAHKAAVLASRDQATMVTAAFSGRPGRSIANEFARSFAGEESTLLPFPLQQSATAALRAAAARRGETRAMQLWAGQGAPLSRDLSARELVAKLVEESNLHQ